MFLAILAELQIWSSGYDARFTRERSGVQSPLSVLLFSFFILLKNT